MAGVTDLSRLAEHAPLGAPPARPMPLNPSHVATLLWMRWKLAIRGFSRGRVRAIIGYAVLVIFVLPWLVAGAVATGVGYLRLPHIVAEQLLFAVLAAIYLIWVALPLLQYTLNEGLDVTRLQIYPVTRAEMMVSLVLATFFDVGTVAILVLYVPIVIGWSVAPLAAVVTVLALALAYIHTVGMSQLIMAALMGVLRSRRFRDTSIIIFAAVGAACSVGGQFIGRLASASSFAGIERIRIDGYLQYTPPGMAARAIEQAAVGQYGTALLWLAGLAALVPVLLWVWALVLDRSITTAETAGAAPGRRGRSRVAQAPAGVGGASAVTTRGAVPVATPAAVSRARGGISPAALAIAQKDLRYLWRDPQLKASLLSALFLLVLVVLPFGDGPQQSGFDLQPYRVLFACLPTLVVALNLSLNALGLERRGLQMLFLFPVRPLDVFWGKNLTVAGITVAAQIVLTLALAVITGGWFYVPLALAGGLAAMFVLLACGNVSSVLIPFRVREMRMGRSGMSSENGLLRALLSMLTMLIVALLLIPVAAAIGVPLLFDRHTWLVGTLPFAVLYGIVLHQVATRLIAPVMLARAPDILNATVKE
ncbi:MAG TPA: hypothetical protein VGN32_18050 [Ktedonobacterales bacterium]|nr:hypothetical protein [Ktedonobacterales bacterium]